MNYVFGRCVIWERQAGDTVWRKSSGRCPLWMAPALQEVNWRFGVGRVQSSVRPVDAVGWDCWPWWSPRTRSHSAYQAITPWTSVGLSLFPVWPVCHHIASRSQPR